VLGPPAVWVVVLNWNGAADTLDCLQSLKRLRYPHVTTVVVDNGSTAPEADWIEASGLASAVLRQGENRGYAAGCNAGIRYALEREAGYVWLLNSDAIVDPHCLDALVTAGERDARIGLLSPVVYDHEAPHAIQFAGTVVDLPGERRPTLTSLDDPAARGQEGRLALWGTALLIKRRVLETVGLLDERYFAYIEDMDYSVRAMAAGFATRLVREASVYHRHGFGLAPDAPFREYLITRNEYLFWTTHLRGWSRWSYRLRYIPWVLRRWIDARLRGQPEVEECIASGGWDALRGRWGSWEQRGHAPASLRAVARGVFGWHPYFWAMLLAGNVRGVITETVGRLFRSGPSHCW
jgi:GT2 family glycosyltransferase